MDTSKLYNIQAYSDIVIHLAGDRDIRFHKMVLCEFPETGYFRNLCGPDVCELELKENDPTAVEAVLRYSGREGSKGKSTVTPAGDPGKSAWRSLLNLKIVADKYEIAALGAGSEAQFRKAMKANQAIDDIFQIIRTLQTEMGHDSALTAFAETLRKDHLGALLANEAYRQHLDSDKALLWAQVDVLKFAAQLVEKKMGRCTLHNVLLDGGMTPMLCPERSGFGGGCKISMETVWIDRKAGQGVQKPPSTRAANGAASNTSSMFGNGNILSGTKPPTEVSYSGMSGATSASTNTHTASLFGGGTTATDPPKPNFHSAAWCGTPQHARIPPIANDRSSMLFGSATYTITAAAPGGHPASLFGGNGSRSIFDTSNSSFGKPSAPQHLSTTKATDASTATRPAPPQGFLKCGNSLGSAAPKS